MPNSQVSIVGNVTSEPVLRNTGDGTPVVSFSVAVSEGTKDNPRTSFYDVSAWRSLGLNIVDSIERGARVVVVGVLQQQAWEQNGQKRSKVQIVADAVGPDLRFAAAKVFRNNAPKPQAATVDYPEGKEWTTIQAGFPGATQTLQGTAAAPEPGAVF